MKSASITEAKNNLSAPIDGLRSGSSVLIADRDRPVAGLEPVRSSDEGGLAPLVRGGIVRPGRGGAADLILTERPPRAHGGASIVEAVLAERRESR